MTGTYSNKRISIPGNQMFIVYETSSSDSKMGFMASIHENGIYRNTNMKENKLGMIFFLLTDDSCQYWLDLENQKISSPYYPNWYFANGIDCEWLITAPENHTISLVFDYFKVTQSNTINQNYLFQYILYFTH